MIELVDVTKSYGKVHALRGVSWRAEDGQITGVLGPNGAGKTTSLRIASGLIAPDAGTARVDGFTDGIPLRRRIGALPHAHGLYPRMTPREHVLYFGPLLYSAEVFHLFKNCFKVYERIKLRLLEREQEEKR